LLRRPLIPAAALYAAGAAIGYQCPSAAVAWFAATSLVVALVAAAALRRWRPALLLAAALALAALRGALAHGATAAAERDFARLYESDDPVAVVGEVAALFPGEAARKGDWRHRFKLRDVSFRSRGSWRRLPGALLVEWYSRAPEKGGRAPARGDRIEAVGIVHARRALDPRAPALDDVRLVSGATRTRLLARRDTGGALARFRRDAAQTLSRGLDRHPRERDLILAMTLGLRSEVAPETLAVFRRAGTIHVFAISGLHVGAMALMLVALLSFVGVPRTFVILPLAPLLAAYIYMTDLQPSAVRAALMVCIYYFALFAGRRPDGLGSVALALLAILAANPAAIAETSLVMSFTMVVGILLFTAPLSALCRRALSSRAPARDLRIAGAAGAGGDRMALPRQRLRSLFAVAWNGAVSLFAAALSAALVSFPLTAHIFHTCVPYSLLANVVVVPLAFPVMAVAGAGLFLSAALPGVELLTNAVAARLAWVVCQVSAGVAALPRASFRGEFPLWALVLWYLALYLLLRVLPARRAELD